MELAPIAQITCLNEDRIQIDSGSGFQNLPYGERIFLKDRLPFRVLPLWGTIAPTEDGNGVLVEVNDQARKEMAPHSGEVPKWGWNRIVGGHPNRGVEETFGLPPVLNIKFLGNQDRRSIVPLMQRQERHFYPDVKVVLPSEARGAARLIAFVSPVFDCQDFHNGPYIRDIVTLNQANGAGYPNLHSRVPVIECVHGCRGYEGKGMVLAEVSPTVKPEGLRWRLGVATLAKKDGLLRIHRYGWHEVREEDGTLGFVADHLAQVSLATRIIAQDLDRLWAGKPFENKNEFPFRVIELLDQYVENIARPFGERKFSTTGLVELKRYFLLDWRKWCERMTFVDLNTETERIRQVMQRACSLTFQQF